MGTEKKRGGRGDGNIPDYLFDELKKKFPRALPRSTETLTCETQSQGKRERDMRSVRHVFMDVYILKISISTTLMLMLEEVNQGNRG